MDKQRKPLISNLATARGISLSELRLLAKNEPAEFVRKMEFGAASGKLRFSDIRDIRGLYQALADVQVPIQIRDASDTVRSIGASAFPILTGTLAIAAINDAYMAAPSIGGQLVTELDDTKRVTTIAAVHALDKNVDEVKDDQEFPEISATEEKVEIRHRQNGRKVTIHANAILENEIADIVTRINALGEIAAEWIEEQTLYRVTDYYGSKLSPAEPYVYRPNGTGTALFSASANTPGTRAPSGTRVNSNALVDETDLTNARTVLRAMRNARGKRINIPWSEVIILVPDALEATLMKIVNSELVPGVENEMNVWGPRGKYYIPLERCISSPKMDDMSTATWYMGAFRRQFVRKWKLRFEYMTLGQDTQAYLNSRIAFQARIAWDCEIGATDYPFVVQCLSATTAPGDGG
jgi:hypothetical protein